MRLLCRLGGLADDQPRGHMISPESWEITTHFLTLLWQAFVSFWSTTGYLALAAVNVGFLVGRETIDWISVRFSLHLSVNLEVAFEPWMDLRFFFLSRMTRGLNLTQWKNVNIEAFPFPSLERLHRWLPDFFCFNNIIPFVLNSLTGNGNAFLTRAGRVLPYTSSLPW